MAIQNKIKIKVDFYANTFSTVTIELLEEVLAFNDNERRILVTEKILESLNYHHVKPLKGRYVLDNGYTRPSDKTFHSLYNDTENTPIKIITAKIII